jgi:hypothetical protein
VWVELTIQKQINQGALQMHYSGVRLFRLLILVALSVGSLGFYPARGTLLETPAFQVHPSALEFHAVSGYTVQAELMLFNSGEQPLEWELVEELSLFADPPTEEEVIYQQSGTYGSGPIVIYDLSTSGQFTSEAADDFVVPPLQTWYIDRVEPHGLYSPPGLVAPQANVFFYTDDGGKPGLPLLTLLNQVPTFDWSGMFLMTLPEPLVLESGRYWVSVQPHLNSDDAQGWFWYGHTDPIGEPYHWREAGGYGSGYLDWTPSQVTGSPSPDLSFVLFGEIDSHCDESVDVSWLSTDSTSGVIAAGGSTNLGVSVDASALEPGSYQAGLCLSTNDPLQPVVRVPVNVDVVPLQLGVELGTEQAAQSGLPGTQVVYNLILENLANIPDSFNLSIQGQGWPAELSQTNPALSVGEQITITLSVTVPEGSLAGEMSSLTVTAVSQTDNSASGSAQVTTTAAAFASLGLQAASQAKDVKPGQSAVYQVTVTNQGNAPDEVSFSAAGGIWEASIEPTILALNPGAQGSVTVSVAVPPYTLAGVSDSLTFQAVSTLDDEVSASLEFTTTADDLTAFTLDIPQASLSVWPGGTANYTIHVTNQGNGVDQYTFTIIGSQWSASVSPPDRALAPGESSFVTLSVAPPLNAVNGDQDSLLLRVTSFVDGALFLEETFTTQVSFWLVFTPLMMK